MYFYKQTDANGTMLSLQKCSQRIETHDAFVVEIPESEYNAILQEINTKAEFIKALYSGTITIEDVPVEWQDEVQSQVDELIAEHGNVEDQELSADEALNIILGG